MTIRCRSQVIVPTLTFFVLFFFQSIALASNRCLDIPTSPHQGFGATTPGGSAGSVVRVTNLNDSGPGSLRDAVSKGNRCVVFDIAGEILLRSNIVFRGAFITIDGFTGPPPGITLKNYGVVIRGDRGAHDIIVRGIRVRNAQREDGIQIARKAYHVVIDHVSVHGSADGNIDITHGSHDVTVSWSILAEPYDPIKNSKKNMLVKYNPARVTLHHNIFVKSDQRNPQVRIDDGPGTAQTDITVDMRNNLVWDWGPGHGTLIWYGPWANVVNNFYSSPSSALREKENGLIVSHGARAYVTGNFSTDSDKDINAVGTEERPFPAPSVDTVAACTAAHQVLAGAGARPLDSVDQRYLAAISLPSCP